MHGYGMEKKRCACKGVRSCLLCEVGSVRTPTTAGHLVTYAQCYVCGELIQTRGGDVVKCNNPCVSISGSLVYKVSLGSPPMQQEMVFDGVTIVKEFLSKQEENEIIRDIDSQKWVESQSGRRKQDYGPKVNFKRRKVKLGDFTGLPAFSKPLVDRMRSNVEGLADFTVVELCNLDYRPERGAAIDPHFDDSWLWGERLVTINLLSHSVLTFSTLTPFPGHLPHPTPVQIRVDMPRYSLIVVAGNARYHWQHSIQRAHVTSRRVAVTLRELSKEFSPGGSSYQSVGKKIMETATVFNGQQTNMEGMVDKE